MTCTLLAYVFITCAIVQAFASEQTPAAPVPSQESKNVGKQESAIGIIIDVLKSDDEAMHAAAISMVKDMPGEQVTKALAKELPTLPSMSRVQLLSALAERGDRAALPAVVEAVNAEDDSVRLAALKSLSKLGDASSVTLLAKAAVTARGAEQKAARESLYRLCGSEGQKLS